MSGFVVSAAFKLVDQFSATADRIGAKASQLGSRMSQLKAKLGSFRTGAIGAVAGILSGVSLNHLLKEGANEEQLVNRFVFAFNNAKERIKLSAEDMQTFLSDIVRKTGVDMEDLQGAIVAPLLMSSKLAGKELSRSIQATVDMARFKGMSTAEEFAGLGKAMSMAMQNPLQAQRLFRSIGLGMAPELKKSIALLVKHGDIVGAQSKMLGEIEKQVGGFGAKNTIGKSLMGLNNVMGDLAASAGAFVHIIAGPAIQKLQTFLAPIAEEMNKMIEAINKGGSAWDAFMATSSKTKGFIVAVVAVMTLALAAILPIIGLIASGIGMVWSAIAVAGPAIVAILGGITAGFLAAQAALTVDWAGLWSGFTSGVQTALSYVTAVYDKIVSIGGAFNSFMAAVNPINIFSGGAPTAKLDEGVGGKAANGEVQVNVKVSADPNTKASVGVSSVGSGLKVGKTSAGQYGSNYVDSGGY